MVWRSSHSGSESSAGGCTLGSAGVAGVAAGAALDGVSRVVCRIEVCGVAIAVVILPAGLAGGEEWFAPLVGGTDCDDDGAGWEDAADSASSAAASSASSSTSSESNSSLSVLARLTLVWSMLLSLDASVLASRFASDVRVVMVRVKSGGRKHDEATAADLCATAARKVKERRARMVAVKQAGALVVVVVRCRRGSVERSNLHLTASTAQEKKTRSAPAL